MAERWRGCLIRFGIAVAILVIVNLAVMFFWSPKWFTYWQVPASCAILMSFMGLLLFDTLFQDRPR